MAIEPCWYCASLWLGQRTTTTLVPVVQQEVSLTVATFVSGEGEHCAGVFMLPRKFTVPEVLPVARRYVAKPENATGGSLHIVLEDDNVDDDNVEFCEGWAEREGDKDGVKLARALRLMTKTQRSKIARKCWWNDDGSRIA